MQNNNSSSRVYGSKKYTNKRINSLTETVRSSLVTYSRSRKNRVVTVDDVHSVLNNLRVGQRETEVRLALTNRVFNDPTFRQTGKTVASRRPAAKYRRVNEWAVSR